MSEGFLEVLTKIVDDDRLLVRLLVAYASQSDVAHFGNVQEFLSKEPPTLRVQLLENFELIEKALERARALVVGCPVWLSENDRVLMEAFTNRYSED